MATLPKKEQYIVYGLIDPNSKLIRYIGKSIQGITRINDHWRDASFKEGNTRKIQWVKKLKENNIKFDYCILYIANYNLTKEEANTVIYRAEQHLIKTFKDLGYDLLNHTDGGPGAIGRKVSEETRKKMSDTAKKRGYPVWLKPYNEIRKNKLKKKYPKTLAEGRPSRSIPGARQKMADQKKKKIKRINPTTKEEIVILGVKEAAKQLGGKCNKTGIRLAINSGRFYYGYLWSWE